MYAVPESNAPRLSWLLKLLYGMGAISESVKSLSFGLFLLFFYSSVRGLPGTLVGAAMAASMCWDAAVDPVIGRWSDRLQRLHGRRHGLMLAGSLTMGPAFIAVFSPPAALNGTGLFCWLMVWNVVLRTAHSAFTVPYHAVGAELSQDYHERTSITGFRAVLGLAGTMAAATASFTLFFRPTSAIHPQFAAEGYGSMSLAFGSAMTIASLIATLGTLKSGRLQALPEITVSSRPLVAELRDAVRIRSFVTLTVAGSLFFLAAVLNATVALHYLTYFAKLPEGSAFSLFQAGFYIFGLAGAAVWIRFSKVIEKQTAFQVATFGTAFVMAGAFLLVGQGRWLGIGNTPALLVGNALAGLCASAVWILPPSMLSDVVDEYQARTGLRPTGTLFGAYSLSVQVAGSLALGINGLLIDKFAGLIPGVLQQSPQTIERIGILFAVIPASLLFVSGFVIRAYSLNGQRVMEAQNQIREASRPRTAAAGGTG